MDLRKQWHIVDITHRIELISSVKPTSKRKVLRKNQRLVVLLPYLYAAKKHVAKIVQFYISLGFDVLCVFINVTEILFPTVGSQVCTYKQKFLKVLTNFKKQAYFCRMKFFMGFSGQGSVTLIMLKVVY